VKKLTDSLADLGRFSEPALFILISLADGPKHGYAMTQDIARVSGQQLGPGTLYGAIARLEARRWIEPLPADDRRQPYKLTGAGQRVLRARLDSLRAVTKIGRARLGTAVCGS
jgi:DNA-binding PadR family transcriptional regulator